MASEVKIGGSLQVIKANAGNLTDNESGLTFDQTGTHTQQTIQDVGFVTHEAVAIAADLGTPGWVKLKNLDLTNSISFGPEVAAAFVAFLLIPPGGICLFHYNSTTMFVKANVATCKMRASIAEA